MTSVAIPTKVQQGLEGRLGDHDRLSNHDELERLLGGLDIETILTVCVLKN